MISLAHGLYDIFVIFTKFIRNTLDEFLVTFLLLLHHFFILLSLLGSKSFKRTFQAFVILFSHGLDERLIFPCALFRCTLRLQAPDQLIQIFVCDIREFFNLSAYIIKNSIILCL